MKFSILILFICAFGLATAVQTDSANAFLIMRSTSSVGHVLPMQRMDTGHRHPDSMPYMFR